ncbi:MAG: LysM peptidoglycan-binding domain-containing M23 family metallopeptidase [Deltaproteobacteria bacterium]
MSPRLVWLAATLLPFLASCSTVIGIVKGPDQLKHRCEQRIPTPTSDPRIRTQEEEGAFHIVGHGETLRHICQVYGLDLSQVAQINELKPPYSLNVGETIFLPAQALVDEGEKSTAGCPGTPKNRSSWNVAKAIRGKRHPLVPELRFPVPGGVLTSPFGHRWGVFHKGLDIAAPIGKAVFACAKGRVIFTGRRKKLRGYGRIVVLDHGRGVYTQYAHLSRILVRKGQRVRGGQRIALVGNSGRSTGPHLHLEVRVSNQMYNPLAYFAKAQMRGIRVAKRFTNSPMGPVQARWRVPDLLAARR